MINEHIKYRQVRTFKELLNVAFNYFRLHIKSIFKIMLLYVMPFFFVSIIASYYFNASGISLSRLLVIITTLKQHKPVEFICIVLPYFVGVVLQNQFLNKHLTLNEGKEDLIGAKDFKPSLVEDFKQHFPNVFFLVLTALLIFLVSSPALGGLLQPYFEYSFGEDPIGYFLQVLPLLILFGLIVPMSLYFAATSLFFSLRDKLGVFESLKKVWEYAKNNLLLTWTISLIAFVVAYILNIIFQLPLSSVGFIIGFFRNNFSGFDSSMFLFINIFTTFFMLIVWSTFQLICIYHITSSEEQKEGNNIREKIENI
jgi:hypothetical protein